MASLRVNFHIFMLIAYFLQTYSTTASSARDQYVYPINVNSERDLAKCPENVACNVIYRRFWFAPVIQRHCRCPGQGECSSALSGPTVNHTLMLDNRNEFKFCSRLDELKECTVDQLALKVVENVSGHRQQMSRSSSINGHQKIHSLRLIHETVEILCHCPEPHFWKPVPDKPNFYTCSMLASCNEDDICGYIRTDLFSTYYQCSCPIGQICVSQDKVVHNRKMLQYSGPVYTAFCKKR